MSVADSSILGSSKCKKYSPDNVFKRFKVVEFPPSFVGLSTSQILDVEIDLHKSAYLKTMCDGRLMKFDEAREISASHRAFNIEHLLDHSTIQVNFQPKNESVSRTKRKNQHDNRFVFDLRLIQVNEVRCCELECHAEIGRYYISGQYEYCKISHFPKVVNFGNVAINSKVTKYIRIRNDSNLIAAKMWLDRVTCFDVVPLKFTIAPKSSIRISISVRPTGLKVARAFVFKIRNPHDVLFDNKIGTENNDENYITYIITNKINISFDKIRRDVFVESLHKLIEPLPKYTFVNDEMEIRKERKVKASKYLDICKSSKSKNPSPERHTTGRDVCYTENSSKDNKLDTIFFNNIEKTMDLTSYDLFDILFLPYTINFGRVAISTYGESELTIKNKTKYDTIIKLFNADFVLFTKRMLPEVTLKIRSLDETKLIIYCLGSVEGRHRGTINYLINGIYSGKQPFLLYVGNPILRIEEKFLKFGMVTTDSFITTVPVRIYNHFNIKVDFKWDELQPDTPFVIIPNSGSVPSHSCKICAVMYNCKPSKSKVHEVDLISESITTRTIHTELSVITRKLSIKFLQQAVIFKDIPLNLKTVEKVKLENSSREIALFHVVEPLIPGLIIEPMSGIIRPKMIMTFDIIVKISCIMEFMFDILIRINNKENIVLPISGNVVEPRIIIQPKNIYMSRIPCEMITYVPITFQNLGPVKSEVEVLDTGDDNIFNVYTACGNDKERVFQFSVDVGQSKIVYIKVCDIFRREYEMYIPFKINGLLGPPDQYSWSTELHHYIGEYEQYYENNPKVKLKTVNKDISYCRISGVITVPWVRFSVEKFELDYVEFGKSTMEFTMTNVSKYHLCVTIVISKLAPNFTLDMIETGELEASLVTETNIKFELDQGKKVDFLLTFHPKGHGRFVTTAVLFLDKQLTIPYYNLTFIGKRETCLMTPSTYRVIFPPCHVGTEITRVITVDMEAASDLESFKYVLKEQSNLTVEFVNNEIIEKDGISHTILTIELKICAHAPHIGNIMLHFMHDGGSACDVEVHFCITYCLLTLHANHLIKADDNPYPYYPLSSQSNLYNYLEKCTSFLEKWMFQQGFRRDLNPIIPDTFHAISSALSTQSTQKSKGINVSYLNFVRRIAGPLMKHIRKILVQGFDDTFKFVKEIHDTYREIINLLRSRGANLWALQAKFLLSHEQFVIYSDKVTPKCNADFVLTQTLLSDVELFNRLNKQSWLDFILQSYKVFVIDSCFFECLCVSIQPRDIVKVLVDWYNEQIIIQHKTLRGKDKSVKHITNLTVDLSDGIALASAIINYCPFLTEHFSLFCEIQEKNREGDIINNACLIVEAMNQLRLYFPLSVKDLIQPNYLQMLFLSIHLYVVLPMFKPKDTIKFNPPLLRSSSRQVLISPSSQESLIFTFMILNNNRNNIFVEKNSGDNGKKIHLNVKYTANFVDEEKCILLIHGYNKTRIFDTYIVFLICGCVGVLTPVRKCRVTGPLYRPNKVDVQISSPFITSATFQMFITDVEPTMPVHFEDERPQCRFYLRRLNLIDKEVHLYAAPKDQNQDIMEQKLYFQMICLSTQVGNSWIWFLSDIGQFFIRVTTQPRWDMPMDSLQAKVQSWPMDPCSCGEACECYRTTVLMVPHRNELMVKALRYALLEHASEVMMNIFDKLIDSTTGKIILTMLLEEGGTTMSDVYHILRSNISYRITSKALMPRIDRVTLYHHTNAMLALPLTIPAHEKYEKYSITFTSNCGMDVRTYRIFFIEYCEEAYSES